MPVAAFLTLSFAHPSYPVAFIQKWKKKYKMIVIIVMNRFRFASSIVLSSYYFVIITLLPFRLFIETRTIEAQS